LDYQDDFEDDGIIRAIIGGHEVYDKHPVGQFPHKSYEEEGYKVITVWEEYFKEIMKWEDRLPKESRVDKRINAEIELFTGGPMIHPFGIDPLMGELCDKEIREHARRSTTYSPDSSSSESLYILTRRVLEIHQACNEQQHSAGDLQCNLANIGIFSVNRLIELLYEGNQDYEVINRMLASNPRINIDPIQERTLIFLRESAIYMHMRYREDNEYYRRMMDHYCKMDGDNTGYKHALPNGDLNCEMDENSGVSGWSLDAFYICLLYSRLSELSDSMIVPCAIQFYLPYFTCE
jgi:hypothetical protein